MKLNKLLTTKIPNKVFLILGLLIVLIAAVSSYIFIQKNFIHNYAEETAKPLESALIKAGAVKVCSRGDSGKGPSNQSPNYTVVFKTNLSRAAAIEVVTKSAQENGYGLVKGDSNYREITNYYDNTAKNNSFSDLENEPMQVSFGVYSGGTYLGCPDGVVYSSDEQAAIKLDISLPEFKR